MANQMLVSADDKQPKLTIEQKINRLLLDPKFSDVCFLVGDQREKIYAHKLLLVTESEVFESMFYGELKEMRYEIEAPDLSPVGFRNMMKYFYTKKVEEIDLSEIYPTYMAANKYLASALIRDLTDHITKNCMDVSNVCLIYDQLLKLAIDQSLIHDVKFEIADGFAEACASASFEKIDEDTLVSILKFNWLNIAEFELLKACLRWTDCEVARRHSGANPVNKRAAFETIKHLIRFGDIEVGPFGSIVGLQNYLTMEEIGSIFFHLSQPCNPIQIDYRSPRGTRIAQIVKARKNALNQSAYELGILIKVNKAVWVSSIKTFGADYCSDLKLEIYKDKKALILNTEITKDDWMDDYGCQSFTIDLALLLQRNTKYKLVFSLKRDYSPPAFRVASRQMTLKSEESGVVFEIESANGFHCIQSIAFNSFE